MNSKESIVESATRQVNPSGFALQQALMWIVKCYELGAAEMKAADEVAAANVNRMVASGEAYIVARVDLSQQSCSFLFCRDNAGEDATELQLFASFFEPMAPTSNRVN